MSKYTRQVKTKIQNYKPKGGLVNTASLICQMSMVKHKPVKEHFERVALMCDAVAKQTKKDSNAAFFAGLLHDLGKLLLPHNLFDGHEITAEEYQQVKEHAIAGFKALNKTHLFTAMCAGLHHNLYKAGYGVTVSDFPNLKKFSPATIKKVLEISTIVSVCDFIDAFTHRKTTIKDGSDANSKDLKTMLYEKYPNDHQLIDVALGEIK